MTTRTTAPAPPTVTRGVHGRLPTGEQVPLLTLAAPRATLVLSGYGGRVVRLLVPDADEGTVDVVLGFDDLAGYLADEDYHGATVGRYANRIGRGTFPLDGRAVRLPTNHHANTLHGGPQAFEAQLWDLAGTAPRHGGAAALLHRTSPDGENGFPGTLEVSVHVEVVGGDVVWEYEATTDAPTVVNLTQHSYLNLAGGGSAEDHLLTVDATRYLPGDEELLPLPEGAAPVEGTVLDLRSPRRVGDVVRGADPQLVAGRGVDHCFLPDGAIADGGVTAGLRRGARLEHPGSGRWAELWTDQPGLQVYTGGWLDGSQVGRGGRTLRQGDGVALEPQRLPDAPNRPDLGDVVLRPGETYRQRSVLRTGTAAADGSRGG